MSGLQNFDISIFVIGAKIQIQIFTFQDTLISLIANPASVTVTRLLAIQPRANVSIVVNTPTAHIAKSAWKVIMEIHCKTSIFLAGLVLAQIPKFLAIHSQTGKISARKFEISKTLRFCREKIECRQA